MQLLKIKKNILLLTQCLFLFSCKKDLDFENSKTIQMETTLEVEVRDKRITGAFPSYWGYVFKIERRPFLPDSSITLLKYSAATNSTVSYKLPFEYTLIKAEDSEKKFNYSKYYFVACQDPDYYHLKPNITPIAKTNGYLDQLSAKETNRIYAEFK
jgi:hypothetical protein